MKLYSFFRSGTSHRLRIALNLKGVDYDYVAVNLRSDEQATASYRARNPQAMVPTLELDDGTLLTQSPAIIEWLEETHPQPALLPSDRVARAHVRALAAIVGCDVHPINNRRILQTLRQDFGADEAAIQRWCAKWIAAGFDALEALLAGDHRRSANFCYGPTPTLADAYLIPQISSARRFKVEMNRWPRLLAIDAACGELEAFRRAAPSAQPDAPA